MGIVSISRGAALVAALVFLAACGGGGSREFDPEPTACSARPPATLPPPPPPPPRRPPLPNDPGPGGRSPLLFITQVPITGTDFTRITGTFGNHVPNLNDAPRGGDLMIAYPKDDGTFDLRNLTREAGFGMKDPNTPETVSCAKNMVAVREPSVSWDGTKALVSIVAGCSGDAHWQIYEVEGLQQGQTVKFTLLEQPDFNNVSPIYSPEGDGTEHIIYSSDMSWHGPTARHLKCLDEYEEKQSTCGLFKLDRAGGVTNLDPSPSGSFTADDRLVRPRDLHALGPPGERSAGGRRPAQARPVQLAFRGGRRADRAVHGRSEGRAIGLPRAQVCGRSRLRASRAETLPAVATERRWHRRRNAQPLRPPGVQVHPRGAHWPDGAEVGPAGQR